jgi:hypothetical protein
MSAHQQVIEHARTNFLQSKGLLSHALSTTADDRLNWSPSPTARTPIQQAAHAAASLKGILEVLNGRTLPFQSTTEADKTFREWEQQFTAREPVLGLLEENSAQYVQWLEALTPEALNTSVELSFGLGAKCLKEALSFAPSHLCWHAAQINYIQTIYGDRDWHY